MKAGTIRAALSWFRKAVEWSADQEVDPKALEGLALTLKTPGAVR